MNALPSVALTTCRLFDPAVFVFGKSIASYSTDRQRAHTGFLFRAQSALNMLNPAHVPYSWVNNPTLLVVCGEKLGRADIEGSKSGVARSAWPPQASYPFTFRKKRKKYNEISIKPQKKERKKNLYSPLVTFPTPLARQALGEEDRWAALSRRRGMVGRAVKPACRLVVYTRFLVSLSRP